MRARRQVFLAFLGWIGVAWAASPPAPRPLNNCVSELLSRSGPELAARTRWDFSVPRSGWVWVRSEASSRAGAAIRLSLLAASLTGAARGSSAPEEVGLLAHERRGAEAREAMRWLPAGGYTLIARRHGTAEWRRLAVRAIPELVYCKFQYDPLVPPHGPYDWTFVQRFMAANVNCLVGSGAPEHRDFLTQWKALGKRWIVECGVPGLEGEPAVSADQAFDYWSHNPGWAEPGLDGVIADEFLGGRSRRNYPAWAEAVRRLRADESFRGRFFYPYCTSIYTEPAAVEFVRAVVAAGYPFAWERYLPEPPTEAEARARLDRSLSAEMERWNQAIPGAASNLVVCLGFMSMPTTETLNLDPRVDFKVWMDLQFQHLATAPAFRGLYGLMEYTSGYADEETLRWTARLYRHYGLEGRTNLLSPRYGFRYRLEHLLNPDFAEGTTHWDVEPAAAGTVETRSYPGYAWLQGRYPRTTLGDTFAWLRRSAARPNRVSQQVRRLRPGRLYSLRFVTADYRELLAGRSSEQRHSLVAMLDGGAWLERRCFQRPMPHNYAHGLGPFDTRNPAWMNYHYRVFRAQGATARLTFSDWAGPNEPGGPAGQESMLNFVELQPYLEE